MVRARAAPPPQPPPAPAPNPARAVFTAEIDEPSRRFDCPNYAPCLQVAVDRDWPGFSCRRCPLASVVWEESK